MGFQACPVCCFTASSPRQGQHTAGSPSAAWSFHLMAIALGPRFGHLSRCSLEPEATATGLFFHQPGMAATTEHRRFARGASVRDLEERGQQGRDPKGSCPPLYPGCPGVLCPESSMCSTRQMSKEGPGETKPSPTPKSWGPDSRMGWLLYLLKPGTWGCRP